MIPCKDPKKQKKIKKNIEKANSSAKLTLTQEGIISDKPLGISIFPGTVITKRK